MRDIRYFWKDGLSSVGMSSEVELPQFRVLGHRQRATEINLTTGTPSLKDFFLLFSFFYKKKHICNCLSKLQSFHHILSLSFFQYLSLNHPIFHRLFYLLFTMKAFKFSFLNDQVFSYICFLFVQGT